MALLALAAVPAHAQSGDSDLNGDGIVNASDIAILLGSWGGVCAPTISSVSPGYGSTQGGLTITVTGTALSGATSLKIGGVSCTDLTVLSATQIRAKTPAAPAGNYPVSVTTPGGTAYAAVAFLYENYALSSITPDLGPAEGGTTVFITGNDAHLATSLTIGGVPCTALTPVGGNALRAVTPPGVRGLANVVMSGPGFTTTLSNGFAYYTTPAWATVLSVAPAESVVTSAAMRSAIRATGYPWLVRDNLTQIDMVLVPPGSFAMGCTASNLQGCVSDENPVHTVTLTNAFYLGRTEVTQAQWTARMGTNPSFFKPPFYADNPSRPVENVSWFSAQSFLASIGMRFPTEAEWEYACRAGTTTAFHGWPAVPAGTNDDALIGSIAWVQSNSTNQPRTVAQLAANGLGLYDMLGNVSEWVADIYASNYYASSPSVNPTGPSLGLNRVVRGGSFGQTGAPRCSQRGSTPTELITNGFRAARNP